jgi:hypothetical protein
VTYRPEFEGRALSQLDGLPSAAFDALVKRVADLVLEPWDAYLMTPGGDPALRQAIFCQGYGLLSFRVEPVSTLAYLIDHEDAVSLWQAGWSHRSRPGLATRLKTIEIRATPRTPISSRAPMNSARPTTILQKLETKDR